MAKKRNAQDATLINIRKSRADIKNLARRVAKLERIIQKLLAK